MRRKIEDERISKKEEEKKKSISGYHGHRQTAPSARLLCQVKFAAYRQFCEGTAKAKAQAIDDGNAEIEELQAAIQKVPRLPCFEKFSMSEKMAPLSVFFNENE